jgi:membrane protease YdiL (CAAX protease family)
MEYEPVVERAGLRREAVFSLAYYAAFVGYLFLNQESELQHWLTLVLLPFVLICLHQRGSWSDWSPRASLSTVGLRRGNLKTGLVWAIPLGLGVSFVMQLFFSENQEAFRELLTSGRFLYLAPIAFLFLLVTVGFTEEFFFRGILQTRLAELFESNLFAVLAVSVLFGLYHVPYAYLDPHWSSYGDLGAAFKAAMFNGILGGVVIGVVYVKAKGNLVACMIVHALIDVFPAMTQIRFG